MKGKTFKEVDAFVGTGKERKEHGVKVYPKYDMGKYEGIASDAIEHAKLVQKGKDFDLYVIGTCDLVSLKVALLGGGRGDDTKWTDVEDLECLCEKYEKEGEKCKAGCNWFKDFKTKDTYKKAEAEHKAAAKK